MDMPKHLFVNELEAGCYIGFECEIDPEDTQYTLTSETVDRAIVKALLANRDEDGAIGLLFSCQCSLEVIERISEAEKPEDITDDDLLVAVQAIRDSIQESDDGLTEGRCACGYYGYLSGGKCPDCYVAIQETP